MASQWIGSEVAGTGRCLGEASESAEPVPAQPVEAQGAKGQVDDRRFDLAGFPRRVVAFVIDSTVILISLVALLDVLAYAVGDDGYWIGYAIAYFFFVSIPVIALYWALAFALTAWLTGGRSLGKALCGIAIRDAETESFVKLGRLLKRELFRALLAVLLFLPLLADGLSALWSPGRRTWHDRTARTIVVRTRPRACLRHAPDSDD